MSGSDATLFPPGPSTPQGTGPLTPGIPGATSPARSADRHRLACPSGARERLFDDACQFDFFQAVWLLERLYPQRRPVGYDGAPADEVVRFDSRPSLDFPASSIYQVRHPSGDAPPGMTVQFMGLTGPSGILPRHYTELLLHLHYYGKGPEKHALADWLEQFDHRLISLFYRAWEKYRFYVPYARGEYARRKPDPFTVSLYSLIGQGMSRSRGRLRVSLRSSEDGRRRETALATVEDLALLNYAGLFSQRPRTACNLRALVGDYFQLPTTVKQFQGQWLQIDGENQSRLGAAEGYCELAVNLVLGERVWDVQSKIRVRLGPIGYGQFLEFLPDRSPIPRRKAFFVLGHLVRLFVGPDLDFEVQLVLRAEEIPQIRLHEDAATGPRLGWNTWLCSGPLDHDAEEVVVAGEAVRWL